MFKFQIEMLFQVLRTAVLVLISPLVYGRNVVFCHALTGILTHRGEIMKRNTRRISSLVLLFAVALFASSKSWAVNPASVAVSVTISGSLSVSVNPNTYSFGSLATNTGSIAASAITVTNNSTAFRETYSLSASNTADWTLAGAQGSNQFVLAATFSSGMPGGSFVDANHSLTGSSVACSATQFAGNQVCQQVNVGTALSMWFEIVTPTQTSSSATETSTVYVFAAAG